jgi:hypothetical protein
MNAMVGLVVGAIVLVIIVIISFANSDDLKRLQHLKNKRRFGGRRLPPEEEQELDRLLRKYPWY